MAPHAIGHGGSIFADGLPDAELPIDEVGHHAGPVGYGLGVGGVEPGPPPADRFPDPVDAGLQDPVVAGRQFSRPPDGFSVDVDDAGFLEHGRLGRRSFQEFFVVGPPLPVGFDFVQEQRSLFFAHLEGVVGPGGDGVQLLVQDGPTDIGRQEPAPDFFPGAADDEFVLPDGDGFFPTLLGKRLGFSNHQGFSLRFRKAAGQQHGIFQVHGRAGCKNPVLGFLDSPQVVRGSGLHFDNIGFCFHGFLSLLPPRSGLRRALRLIARRT